MSIDFALRYSSNGYVLSYGQVRAPLYVVGTRTPIDSSIRSYLCFLQSLPLHRQLNSCTHLVGIYSASLKAFRGGAESR